jgi:hypothetical protein
MKGLLLQQLAAGCLLVEPTYDFLKNADLRILRSLRPSVQSRNAMWFFRGFPMLGMSRTIIDPRPTHGCGAFSAGSAIYLGAVHGVILGRLFCALMAKRDRLRQQTLAAPVTAGHTDAGNPADTALPDANPPAPHIAALPLPNAFLLADIDVDTMQLLHALAVSKLQADLSNSFATLHLDASAGLINPGLYGNAIRQQLVAALGSRPLFDNTGSLNGDVAAWAYFATPHAMRVDQIMRDGFPSPLSAQDFAHGVEEAIVLCGDADGALILTLLLFHDSEVPCDKHSFKDDVRPECAIPIVALPTRSDTYTMCRYRWLVEVQDDNGSWHTMSDEDSTCVLDALPLPQALLADGEAYIYDVAANVNLTATHIRSGEIHRIRVQLGLESVV